jgi:hypothetical protein
MEPSPAPPDADELSGLPRDALIAQYEELAAVYEGLRESRTELKRHRLLLQQEISDVFDRQRELEALIALQSAPADPP